MAKGLNDMLHNVIWLSLLIHPTFSATDTDRLEKLLTKGKAAKAVEFCEGLLEQGPVENDATKERCGEAALLLATVAEAPPSPSTLLEISRKWAGSSAARSAWETLAQRQLDAANEYSEWNKVAMAFPDTPAGKEAGRRAWEQVAASGDLEILDDYIAQHPQGPFSQQAQDLVFELVYSSAEELATEAGWAAMRDAFPNHPRAEEAFEQQQRCAFEEADDLLSWEALVAGYPEHPRRAEALVNAQQLAMEQAEAEGTAAALYWLLIRYPDHPRAAELTERTWDLAFAEALEAATLESWEDLLSAYPEHPRREEILSTAQRLALEQAEAVMTSNALLLVLERYPDHPRANEVIKRAWDLAIVEASKVGTPEAWQSLIERFPDHPQLGVARSKLVRLEIAAMIEAMPGGAIVAPGRSFGPLKSPVTRASVEAVFGRDRVKAAKGDFSSSIAQFCTDPREEDQLRIHIGGGQDLLISIGPWDDSTTVCTRGDIWRTSAGLGVGSSLQEIVGVFGAQTLHGYRPRTNQATQSPDPWYAPFEEMERLGWEAMYFPSLNLYLAPGDEHFWETNPSRAILDVSTYSTCGHRPCIVDKKDIPSTSSIYLATQPEVTMMCATID
jgi:hypothetical protein